MDKLTKILSLIIGGVLFAGLVYGYQSQTVQTPTITGQVPMASSTGSGFQWIAGNFIAGSNMTITTSTAGQITFTSTGGGGDPYLPGFITATSSAFYAQSFITGTSTYFITPVQFYAANFITTTSTAFMTQSGMYAANFITTTSTAFITPTQMYAASFVTATSTITPTQLYATNFITTTSTAFITPINLYAANFITTTSTAFVNPTQLYAASFVTATSSITPAQLYATSFITATSGAFYSPGFITATSTATSKYTTTTINGLSGAIFTTGMFKYNGQIIDLRQDIATTSSPQFAGVTSTLIVGSTSVSSTKFMVGGGGTAAAPPFTFSYDSDDGIFQPVDDTLAFGTQGLERLRLDANGRAGFGTTTPNYAFTVAASSTGKLVAGINTSATSTWLTIQDGSLATPSTLFAVASSSVNGYYTFINGHISTTSTIPTVSACGTGSPSVKGNDIAGQITAGTVATTCTLTFGKPYVNPPACNIGSSAAIAAQTIVTTTSTLVITGTAFGGDVISYSCFDY